MNCAKIKCKWKRQIPCSNINYCAMNADGQMEELVPIKKVKKVNCKLILEKEKEVDIKSEYQVMKGSIRGNKHDQLSDII